MNMELQSYRLQGAGESRSDQVRDGAAHKSCLGKDVRYVKGVGEKFAAQLKKHFDIHSVYDLLFFAPVSYSDRIVKSIDRLREDEQVCIKGVIESVKFIPRGLVRIEAVVRDASGSITAVWFGRRYILYTVKRGQPVTIFGKTNVYNGRFQIVVADYSVSDNAPQDAHFGRIVPHYPTPESIRRLAKRLRSVILNAVREYAPQVEEDLPPWLLKKYSLIELSSALMKVHFPDSNDELMAAKKRLTYEEAFFLFLAIELSRTQVARKHVGKRLIFTEEMKTAIESGFPFEFTAAQKSAIKEVVDDLTSVSPMYRLLQGDVGSGKTAVAFYMLLVACHNGVQGALIAPTEILAEQHYHNFTRMFPDCHAALLTSSTTRVERKGILERLKAGELKVVIGTHAVLQDDVRFASLSAVVIDEQHKFGVLQREALVNKGYNPHVMVMTATPIPRSLALTIFADAKISVLNQLPPGRKIPVTLFYEKDKWQDCHDLILGELAKGHQAFFVYPLIEESEKIQARSATEMYGVLKRLFSGYVVELIHGRISRKERELIMRRFRDNEINILVSTIVIEIGVDVPNATVIVVDNCERFGLSQLHQLRGRIIRSDKVPYCVLIGTKSTEDASKRIKIMLETSDGFKIAEEDLKIRGPGEFIGQSQKGYTKFRFLNVLEDINVLIDAKRDAADFIKRDPNLSSNWGDVFRERLRATYRDKIHLGTIV